MGEIKIILSVIAAATVTVFEPHGGSYVVLALTFVCNIIFGILADQVRGKGWNLKKLRWAFIDALLLVMLITFVIAGGHALGDLEGAKICVLFVVYSTLYYYGTNVCRNGSKITRENSPAHHVFTWLYWVLSFEFAKRVPFFKQYQDGVDAIKAASRVEEERAASGR